MKQDRGKLDSQYMLNSEELSWVGCVAVESAYLEQAAEYLVWVFAGLTEAQGRAFTQGKNISNLLDLLAALALVRFVNDADVLTRFQALISEIRAVYDYRNTIIHGQWSKDDRPLSEIFKPSYGLAKATLTRRRSAQVFRAANVEETARRLSAQRQSLMEFFMRAQGALYAEWRDRARKFRQREAEADDE